MNYNDKTKTFSEEGKRLLIERKRIVHKAKDKLIKLETLLNSKHDFKYTFIYVPEGKEVNYDDEDIVEDKEDIKIIRDYLEVVKKAGFRAKTVTGTQNDRENSRLKRLLPPLAFCQRRQHQFRCCEQKQSLEKRHLLI